MLVQDLAETTVRAGVQVQLVRRAQLQTEMNAALVVRALGRALDAASRALRDAGASEEQVAALRVAAHAAAGEELRAAEDPTYRDELRQTSLRELEGRPPREEEP